MSDGPKLEALLRVMIYDQDGHIVRDEVLGWCGGIDLDNIPVASMLTGVARIRIETLGFKVIQDGSVTTKVVADPEASADIPPDFDPDDHDGD